MEVGVWQLTVVQFTNYLKCLSSAKSDHLPFKQKRLWEPQRAAWIQRLCDCCRRTPMGRMFSVPLFETFMAGNKLMRMKTSGVGFQIVAAASITSLPVTISTLFVPLLVLIQLSPTFLILTFISLSSPTASDSDPPLHTLPFPSHPSLCVTLQGKAPLTSAS